MAKNTCVIASGCHCLLKSTFCAQDARHRWTYSAIMHCAASHLVFTGDTTRYATQSYRWHAKQGAMFGRKRRCRALLSARLTSLWRALTRMARLPLMSQSLICCNLHPPWRLRVIRHPLQTWSTAKSPNTGCCVKPMAGNLHLASLVLLDPGTRRPSHIVTAYTQTGAGAAHSVRRRNAIRVGIRKLNYFVFRIATIGPCIYEWQKRCSLIIDEDTLT